MTELEVFHRCKNYLDLNGFKTIQLVAPGGQCPRSITLRDSSVRRTVFPDIIAFKQGNAYIGEMKPRFSSTDYRKLISIVGDPGVEAQVARLLGLDGSYELNGVLCHGQVGAPGVPLIQQWVFFGLADVMIVPAEG